MAIDIRQSQTRAVRLVPESEVGFTSPTASIIDADGTELATPTAVVDTLSTTIASAANAFRWTLTSATGVVVGRWYKVTNDGQAYVVQVVDLNGSVVEVEPPLPETPDASSPFVGHEVAVTIPAAATATRGTWFRLEVVDAANTDVGARLFFHVVRQRFLAGFRADHARLFVSANWPSQEFSGQEYDNFVVDVRQEIRAELLERGVYAEIYLDPDAIRPLAHAILRRDLAISYGLVPVGEDDKDRYIERQRTEIGNRIAQLVRSYQPRDADDDGAVDDDKLSVFTVVNVL
uniref:Uncharacterized protein n=1 Tax=viral metagenome TaxID=1070528 RepID=A0A6M3XMC3_9ZZZZ